MTQATFQYKALDQRGAATKGLVTARDQRDAYRQIVCSGLKPIRIRVAARRRRNRRITLREISQFTNQVAVLLEAGIPIVEGLRSIGEQETNERLREIVLQVARDVEGGRNITQSLDPHRAVFGDVYIETVHAAEASGNLVEVMNRLAALLESEQELRKTARAALMYPACVVVALALALTFLLIVIVPKFAGMFSARGLELPLPTQILVWFSAAVQTVWPGLLAGGVIGVFVLRRAWSRRGSRRRIDAVLHRIPFLRDLLTGLAIGRFAQVFGIALRSGLGLIDALDLAGKASGRPLLEAEVGLMRDRVSAGRRLRDVIATCAYFPPFTQRMLSAGEEAADLTKMCQIIARHYEREVSYLSRNIATALEPILITGLAAIVLVVALAIFLPMWNMGALVG